jgi:hypothetical protein
MTCKINFDFWKTTSFLQSHNAQQKAATPTTTKALCLCEKLLSQGPKRLAVAGFVIPKVALITDHINLAIGQLKKMLNSLMFTTKATMSASLPLSLSEIIFSQDNTLPQIPKKYLNF